MNAASVGAAAWNREWVKLYTGVVHMGMVGSAVGDAAPMMAVTHTIEVLATVRVVMVVAAYRMVAAAGSDHCPSVIPSGIHAVSFLKRVV